jgi:hypothetical protein
MIRYAPCLLLLLAACAPCATCERDQTMLAPPRGPLAWEPPQSTFTFDRFLADPGPFSLPRLP